MSINVPGITIWEGSGLSNMARVEGWDGSNLVQADVASIRYWVIKDDGTKEVDAGSLNVADVVYDSIQSSDDRWDTDGTGYNFLHHVAGTDVPDASATYRIEYELTPSAADFSNSPIYLVFQAVTDNIKGVA